MQILIYQDYVHNNGTVHRALTEHFGAPRVGFCDANDIHKGILDENVQMLVLPGGADLFYTEKLNGSGNKAIRRWVEQGGIYLGICAGAYYACASLGWAEGTQQEISGPRELAFFPGRAAGPVSAFIENSDVGKSWNAATRVISDGGLDSVVHYNGGPLFEGQPETVLARYLDLPGQPPAAIECRIGKGKAVLCSFHPETSPESFAAGLYYHRNPSWKHDCNIATLLTPHGAEMRAMGTFIFDHAAGIAKKIAA
jgi:glutamine amidotransferase-like uncharacterized protein